MIEDKISLTIQELNKLKEKLKDLKRDIKDEERIDDEPYLQLKDSYKDLRQQIKDFEEQALNDLHKDASYKQLIEMKIKLEEQIAHEKERLMKHLQEMPQKAFQMKVETESGPLIVQIQPEMKIYVNGKEEKTRG